MLQLLVEVDDSISSRTRTQSQLEQGLQEISNDGEPSMTYN